MPCPHRFVQVSIDRLTSTVYLCSSVSTGLICRKLYLHDVGKNVIMNIKIVDFFIAPFTVKNCVRKEN